MANREIKVFKTYKKNLTKHLVHQEKLPSLAYYKKKLPALFSSFIDEPAINDSNFIRINGPSYVRFMSF